MEINERIKKRRKELSLSADEVAEYIGVSRANYYRYESADVENMPSKIISPLSEILKCNPLYLLGYTDDPIDYNSEEYGDTYVPKEFMPFEDSAVRIKEYLKFLNAKDEEALKEPQIDPRFNDFKFALLHGENDLTEEQKQDLLDYYEFIKSKKR
ncbi:MAG: helix-turn-helix domain-containing protein [Anaerorhabdus sp.]|uniref:helix-turn-helix domain-containing protein n=1 Tax=Anaerorhabdus sp. TaxID=1872524 RepID=UPI003A8AA190